ncbi:hypothetical protein P153DRAFT_427957 [Dothidotthia symphoricarpi CBS 119687]|uniref:Extracellular membrane protein CFEM domain-containing protein n=1 Tax=Dothidotthia symphoricarpi CBS 119687 TaxID=1392245 RepID=A0A6A6AU90_9PLEO|nr:uncharacterized protein P153DRAFT_427957 [Dothidotthia symphoricarpi CBS 119687]KAF2134101.1 hypothetical protein P153DRAFT_427957 [Dothidotthia symphoricarpi CBS 119687]
MQFLFNLAVLAIAIMTVSASGIPSVFNYSQLPSCARNCKILDISERNCLPPAAPVSGNATYVDCVCHSEYLRKLHNDGEICHAFCAHEDDVLIYDYYTHLCGTARASPTMSSLPVSTLVSSGTSASTITTSTGVVELDTTAEPSPAEASQEAIKDPRIRLRDSWKFLLIPVGVIIFFTLFFLGFAIYRRQRRNSKNNRDLERANQYNQPMPLEQLSSPSSQQLRENNTWPGQTPVKPNLTSLMFIHKPPNRDPNFGAHLRFYKSQIVEEERLKVIRGIRPLPKAPKLSLEKIDALMMERIRQFGRPDLPLRMTPKIMR